MIEVPNNLKTEINLYCKSNNITDINGFIVKLIIQGFTIEKYGIQPKIIVNTKPEKINKEENNVIQQPITENKIEKNEEKPNNSVDLYDED